MVFDSRARDRKTQQAERPVLGERAKQQLASLREGTPPGMRPDLPRAEQVKPHQSDATNDRAYGARLPMRRWPISIDAGVALSSYLGVYDTIVERDAKQQPNGRTVNRCFGGVLIEHDQDGKWSLGIGEVPGHCPVPPQPPLMNRDLTVKAAALLGLDLPRQGAEALAVQLGVRSTSPDKQTVMLNAGIRLKYAKDKAALYLDGPSQR